jgi:CRISPR-associated protein Csb2
MFALAVHYLTGRAAAKYFGSHDDPEWPPEPARLFCALVAALHTGGNLAEERMALKWLEQQEPPSISFSDWSERGAYTSYVPANDAAVPKNVTRGAVKREHFAILPEYRNRNGRTFPSLSPSQPVVHFIWPAADPTPRVVQAIGSIAGRIAYLGHSSSLVSVVISDRTPQARIMPSPDGTWGTLRVVREGYLEELERLFDSYAAALQASKGASPRLSVPTIFERYAEVGESRALRQFINGTFGEFHVFRFPPGCELALTATLAVADALRKAAMEKSGPDPTEVLSGHSADGRASQHPHVAFVPLPDVDHAHADGHLLGVAAVLPRVLDGSTRVSVLTALSRVEMLTFGKAGAWPITAVGGRPMVRGLDNRIWATSSRRWATVTPLVLERFPNRLYSSETEEIISQACLHGGFPRPREIIITAVAPFIGVPAARNFPALSKPGQASRFHTHVILCFEGPVRGPMLLGAGRYKGYGLCRPVGEA